MKYKYEFETNELLEEGDCENCPFGYMDYSYDYNVHCVLYGKYGECPLEKVEE